MKQLVYILLALLSIGSAAFITACSATNESANPHVPIKSRPAGLPAQMKNLGSMPPENTDMEGGIVGTGNEDECKKSERKDACNDNVK